LKEMSEAPVKLPPIIVTFEPMIPLVGVKDAMDGTCVTVKLLTLTPLPAALVTIMGPVVAPDGTTARAWVSESSVKLAAGVPLKVMLVTPVKLVPVIVTLVPIGPLEGVKDVILGGASTVKFVALCLVPSALVTLIGPVVAPLGTVARIWRFETTVKVVAEVALKETPVAPLKLLPKIVTCVPMTPLVGLKDEMVGGLDELPPLVSTTKTGAVEPSFEL